MGEEKEKKKEKKSKKKEKQPEETPVIETETQVEKEKEKEREPKRAKRATSNVFALFNQVQIQEFKEAFTLIDQNRDGFICNLDLTSMFEQTGKDPDPKTLDGMLQESPGSLNFTMFLNLFGDKMKGTDPERTLLDAFKMFDADGSGFLDEEYFRDLLMTTGDQFNKDEIKQTWKECPVNNGKIDYTRFVHIIKRGNEDD